MDELFMSDSPVFFGRYHGPSPAASGLAIFPMVETTFARHHDFHPRRSYETSLLKDMALLSGSVAVRAGSGGNEQILYASPIEPFEPAQIFCLVRKVEIMISAAIHAWRLVHHWPNE